MASTSKPGAIVTCLYPRVQDFKFNMSYYLSSHIPLTAKLWAPHGLLDVDVVEVTQDSDSAIKVIMRWKTLEGYEEALEDGETKQLIDDVENFTNAKPQFIAGKIVAGS